MIKRQVAPYQNRYNNQGVVNLIPEFPGISENMIMQIREPVLLIEDITGIAFLVRLL